MTRFLTPTGAKMRSEKRIGHSLQVKKRSIQLANAWEDEQSADQQQPKVFSAKLKMVCGMFIYFNILVN